MCYERYLRRRREADEGREMWPEFDRTQPVDGREPAPEATEPEPAEMREAIATPER
jgi:hypothetical protein